MAAPARLTSAQQRAQRQLSAEQVATLPVLTAELTLMQEYELSELRQASTLLFLVHDVSLQADLKREKDKKEGGRKTRCLGKLAAYLKSKNVPGGTRLEDASDLEVNKGVLRFKSPHQDQKLVSRGRGS